MNDIETLPAPVLKLKAQPLPPWHAERDAYWRLHGELLKTHENKFVAIYKGEVVATGETMWDVAVDVEARFGDSPILIRQVTRAAPRVERIMSPFVVREA